MVKFRLNVIVFSEEMTKTVKCLLVKKEFWLTVTKTE